MSKEISLSRIPNCSESPEDRLTFLQHIKDETVALVTFFPKRRYPYGQADVTRDQ